MYIAAKLLDGIRMWRFLQLAPGQGKTIVMVMIIHYLAEHNNLPSAIVTDLPYLQTQLMRVTKAFRLK